MLRALDEIQHTTLKEKEVHTPVRINDTRTPHLSHHRHVRPVNR